MDYIIQKIIFSKEALKCYNKLEGPKTVFPGPAHYIIYACVILIPTQVS